MSKELKSIQDKITKLEHSISSALKKWEPFKDDTESNWLSNVEAFVVTRTKPMAHDEIEKIQAERGFSFPKPYVELVTSLGAFTIGSSELKVKMPAQVEQSYGELISQTIPEHTLDNFKEGHYHDFVVLAEYGTFPQQLVDYSGGIAFNKKNESETIVYDNEDLWISSETSKRKNDSSELFFSYLIEKLDNIIERAEEPVSGLLEEIEYYENEDE